MPAPKIDWSDLDKSIQEFNCFFKATTGIHGGRASQSGHETGVASPSVGAKGQSNQRHMSPGAAKRHVIGRMMEREKIKPKLPR